MLTMGIGIGRDLLLSKFELSHATVLSPTEKKMKHKIVIGIMWSM